MSSFSFTLVIPDPEVRKRYAPPSKKHKDKSKYSRKQKHKAKRGEAPDSSGAFFMVKLVFLSLPKKIRGNMYYVTPYFKNICINDQE